MVRHGSLQPAVLEELPLNLAASNIDHSGSRGGFSLPRCVPEWNHVDASPWTVVVQGTVRSEAVVAWSKGSGAASGRSV
jgi:hypothetical protein